MVRMHAGIIDDSDSYAVELAGRDRFDWLTILWFKQALRALGELVASVRWWTLIPGLLGCIFVFASISGYQNVGAAATIAVLVANQLIGGLALDITRNHGVTLRAMVRPAFGAVAGRRMADCEAPAVLMGLRDRAAFGELLAARRPDLLDIACRDAR